MQAIKAIRALIEGASAVTSLVGTSVWIGDVPLGVALPAIGLKHISTVEVPPISATPGDTVVRTRIQVMVVAQDYAGQENVIDAVRLACNYQRGTLGGARVISVMRDGVGPDFEDGEPVLYSKTIDWLVTHYEA